MIIEQYIKDREIKKAKMLSDFESETNRVLSILSYKEHIMPKVNEILHNLGLKSVTEEQLSSCNSECMSFSVEGTSFKFISFKGYDARGRGKNHTQLADKARKIEKVFADAEIKLSVNEFSIEDDVTNPRSHSKVNMVSFTLINTL